MQIQAHVCNYDNLLMIKSKMAVTKTSTQTSLHLTEFTFLLLVCVTWRDCENCLAILGISFFTINDQSFFLYCSLSFACTSLSTTGSSSDNGVYTTIHELH